MVDRRARRAGGAGRADGAPLAIALLVLTAIAAFPDVLFGGRTLSAASYVPGVLPSGPVGAGDPPRPPPVRDVEGAAWVDEPSPYLVHRALADGGLALWTEASGLGAPLLGNPNSGALAPLQWPVNAWPSPVVQDLAWIGRVVLLGVFTWLLARAIGCGPAGAFAAGAAVMLSGQTLEWIDHHPLNTDVFVPLVLFAALALPAAGTRGIALLAAAIAAGCLGVKPQSAVVAAGFGAVWLAAAVRDRTADARARGAPDAATRAHSGQAAQAWIAGGLLGAAAAAIALLSFADAFGDASGLVRAGRTAQSEWAVPPSRWPSLVGPWALALVAPAGDVAAAHGGGGLPHAGAVVLVAAAVGLWRARRRRLAWALAATIALELAKVHGLLPLRLSGVPLLGSVNYVKYSFPLYLALALLAGLGASPARASRALTETALRRRRWAWLVGAAVVAELLWLAPRRRPERVPPYAPAPWVDALRDLVAARPGRIAGPVEIAPPLVSGALGFRDLRAIDVLTPRATWEFVSSLVAPSQGLTWILADPDPLLAATGPGAPLADLRWVLAREPLRAEELPAAVRALVSGRRTTRLFAHLERFSFATADLGGGIADLAGDRRFHWTCETPCRMRFDVADLPERFAAGLSAARAARLRARLAMRDASGDRGEVAATVDVADPPAGWADLCVERRDAGAARAAGERSPGTIELEIASDGPAERVFVGGVGPGPGEAAEARDLERELAARRAALARLELRWADSVAYVYESPLALGAAYFAEEVVRVPDAGALDDCVVDRAGRAVACIAEADVPSDAWPATSSGTATVLADRDETASVATASEGGGVVVFARLFHPGWRAAVDGAPAPTARVDGALLAVAVPAGPHRVEIAFRPRSFFAGAGISLAALAAIVLLALPPRTRDAFGRAAFEAAAGRR